MYIIACYIFNVRIITRVIVQLLLTENKNHGNFIIVFVHN